MTRYLYIATLVLFASCTQRKDNADQNKSTEHLTQDTIKKVNNTMDLSSEANVRSIDTLSEKLKYFIPSDYSAIDASFGDANLDGISDAILVLGKTDEDEDSAPKRPLLLLLGQSNGSYKLTITNDNIVESLGTSDAHLDSFIGIKIENGYISVEHQIARLQSSWENTTTFKFDKTEENWFLHEEHFTSSAFKENADLEKDEMETVDDIIKTVKDFGIISLDKYDVTRMKQL